MSAPSTAPAQLIFAPFSLVAPVGLRFWDAVRARFVTSGLEVTAAPLLNPARRVAATVSQSGVYAFTHLPGLHRVEFGAGDQAYWDNLPETSRRDFVISIRDPAAHFQDFTCTMRLPGRGIFNLTCPAATVTPAAPPASIALFSTPARPAPPAMAMIRTELRLANGQPAAWAVVAAQFDGQTLAHGLADRQGRVALILDHMRAMKHRAIVCNIGHFDSEIQVAGLKNFKWDNIKPQVDEIEFPDGKKMILLSEGRLVNLGNATGHPSFVMSASFTNQTLAQIELWTNPGKYEKKVYVLPKHLDEKVAMLHLAKVGATLTTMSKQQADYIGVSPQGPFKAEQYRY